MRGRAQLRRQMCLFRSAVGVAQTKEAIMKTDDKAAKIAALRDWN
jgi:hypothetical protein